MNTYLFSTYTSVKPYMDGKYWVDADIIRDSYIDADNVEEALNKFKSVVEEYGITISKTAMKRKSEMFIDGKNGEVIQTGYVITGKTEICDYSYNICGVCVYLDLWVDIKRIVNPFTEVENNVYRSLD